MKHLFLLIFGLTLFISGCKKEPMLATVATGLPVDTEISAVNAILRGSATNDGNAFITEKGIVAGTSPNPTILSGTNTILGGGSGTGDFSVNAPNLTPNTTYYYRAFAVNSAGTAYGEERSFTTRSGSSAAGPEIPCGKDFNLTCLQDNYTVQKPATADYKILPNYYAGRNCLLLTNPHSPQATNPQGIQFNSVIKNLKKHTSYRISCDAKIKGYPDFLSNPSFAFYAYTNNNWYGQHYYGSASGQLHFSDWSNHSYVFISGEETTLSFQLYSLYDSTWVTNLAIKEL